MGYAKGRSAAGSYGFVYQDSIGAVELPLSCAQALDPDGIGLEYWLSGSPPNDDRIEFAKKRSNCYQLVLDSLGFFEEKALQSSPQGSTSVEEPETIRSHAYDLAFAAEDEMFHSMLYDWLIEKGHADDLLAVCDALPLLCTFPDMRRTKMRPPFLEAHLRREPATISKYQLLWQYYVKDGRPLRAAEVLAILAETPEYVHVLLTLQPTAKSPSVLT